jgi:hypothetical protein
LSVTLAQPTAVIVDETPLSLITMKSGHRQGDACKAWYAALDAAGHRFYVPEIADYELRRELIRSGKSASIVRLDAFNSAELDRYLPLTTVHVRLAAQLWATARNAGSAGASDAALDGDVLIAAQALTLAPATCGLQAVIVASENVRHLSHMVSTALWSDIK